MHRLERGFKGEVRHALANKHDHHRVTKYPFKIMQAGGYIINSRSATQNCTTIRDLQWSSAVAACSSHPEHTMASRKHSGELDHLREKSGNNLNSRFARQNCSTLGDLPVVIDAVTACSLTARCAAARIVREDVGRKASKMLDGNKENSHQI